jgi:hypothetical protein
MQTKDVQSIPPLAEETFPDKEGKLSAKLLEKSQHVLHGSHTPRNGCCYPHQRL